MLSIIIPTLNEEKFLYSLLNSIKKQDFKGDYEIIVADNNSTDGTLKLAESYGCKITLGGLPAKGRNEGAKIAGGGLFLFVDGDTILPEDFLQNSISEFKKRKLDLASFFIYPYQKNKIFKLGYNLFYNWLPALLGEKVLPHATNSILVKRELHQKLGGFDESIKIAEDHFYARQGAKIGSFGLIRSSHILASTRRFDKDGLFVTLLKYIWAEFYMILFGPIKSNIFNYKFAHYYKNQNSSRLKRIFNFLIRALKESMALIAVIFSWPIVGLTVFFEIAAKLIKSKLKSF